MFYIKIKHFNERDLIKYQSKKANLGTTISNVYQKYNKYTMISHKTILKDQHSVEKL